MEPYKQLEYDYASYVRANYAVSCNSGTAALHLALKALGVGPGDEVIVPDFTMAACGFAVSYCGAVPVFVDCGFDLCIDPAKISDAIGPRTKAIIAVHIYGRLCNMAEITRIARERGLAVVEDAAEAQGAVKGSLADITCYSFYKNKIIAAEEGGICTTNKKLLAERMEYYKNMCFGPSHDYFHADVGFNYRMPNAQAVLALQSLKEVETNLQKRRQVETWYNELIRKDFHMPPRDVVWVYDVKLPYKDWVPGARRFFKPLSGMPMWNQQVGENARMFSAFMYLPVNPTMTLEDVKKIVSQCKI